MKWPPQPRHSKPDVPTQDADCALLAGAQQRPSRCSANGFCACSASAAASSVSSHSLGSTLQAQLSCCCCPRQTHTTGIPSAVLVLGVNKWPLEPALSDGAETQLLHSWGPKLKAVSAANHFSS